MGANQILAEFIPLCSFGRSENIFYQGRLGLISSNFSPRDLDIDLRLGSKKVVAGHFLDLSNWSEYLEIIRLHKDTSVLISYGYEFAEHREKITDVPVLIVIDRPIEAYRVNSSLPSESNFQWVIIGNKLFQPSEVLESLQLLKVPDEKIYYSFIEPRLPKSSLLSIEEIVIWKDWFLNKKSSLRQLIFYKSGRLHGADLSTFSSNSDALERELIRAKEDNQLVVYLAYIWTFFSVSFEKGKLKMGLKRHLIHPLSWYLRWRIAERLFHIIRIIPHRLKDILNILVGQVVRLRWGIIEELFHVTRMTAGKLQEIILFLRHRIFPLMFWPIFKLYWFLEYQWKTRIKRDRNMR